MPIWPCFPWHYLFGRSSGLFPLHSFPGEAATATTDSSVATSPANQISAHAFLLPPCETAPGNARAAATDQNPISRSAARRDVGEFRRRLQKRKLGPWRFEKPPRRPTGALASVADHFRHLRRSFDRPATSAMPATPHSDDVERPREQCADTATGKRLALSHHVSQTVSVQLVGVTFYSESCYSRGLAV